MKIFFKSYNVLHVTLEQHAVCGEFDIGEQHDPWQLKKKPFFFY